MGRTLQQLMRGVMLVACCAWCGCGGVSSVGGGSLSDVMLGTGTGGDASQLVPGTPGSIPADSTQGVARARVRNESQSRQADVTVRFIRDDVVVRLAFVRVASETATTVLSPEAVDSVELSGVDSTGTALTGATLLFGRDFDETHPAEYIILDDRVVVETPDVSIPVDDVQVRPVPEAPSAIELLEPSSDTTVLVGSTLTVRWSDVAGTPGSAVRLFLRAVDTGELIPVGPAVNAALDGLNDEFRIVLGGLRPGVYEVLAEIDSLGESVASLAPGRVTVVAPTAGQNAPPSLSIVTPVATTGPVTLTPGGSFTVVWEDGDSDDNATIVFTLEPSDPAQVGLGVFQVSPPFAEDLDGPAFDSATLSVGGVLPGLYDLVGTITDGSLTDVARVAEAVLVQDQVETPNEPPTIAVLQPAADVEVVVGGSFLVRWTDQDVDDDARISLYLDPVGGSSVFDGDEILLTNSVSEDVDGVGDQIQIGLSADFARGEFYLVAVISDGTDEAQTRAGGVVVVVDAPSGGGRVDADPDPEDESPVEQTVTMLDPLYDVTSLTSSTFSLAIPTTGVVGTGSDPRSIVLTNVPFGGQTLVDFVPTQWLWEAHGTAGVQDDLRVTVPRDLVPNGAWPRSFEVRLVLEDALGSEQELVSPGPLWLPQEVEVLNASAQSYSCDAAGALVQEDSRFVGLAIEWFGGGMQEGTPQANVEFWLSSDGLIPSSGTGDATHRLIWRSAGSPNLTRTAYIGVDVVSSGLSDGIESVIAPVSAPSDISDPASATLSPGDYHLLAVALLEGGGRLTAPAYPTTVSVCRPSSSAGPSD